MHILITGSIAYDRIMNFSGYFKNEILPDKIHILNVSFFIEKMQESFGGTAGNIAYNLSLLKIKPLVWGNVGKDFSVYEQWMKKNNINISLVKKIKESQTASAYIITDKADNQIAGFFPGAMSAPLIVKGKRQKAKWSYKLAIVSPQNPVDMVALPKLFKQKNIPYIFDPGQQVASLTSVDLKKSIAGSVVTIGNDYEISLIKKKTGFTEKQLLAKTQTLITTMGEKGSVIMVNNKKIKVPAVKVKKVIDPTGAGDAYRAGIIYGMLNQLPWKEAGDIAAKISAAAVQKQGTQNHIFSYKLKK